MNITIKKEVKWLLVGVATVLFAFLLGSSADWAYINGVAILSIVVGGLGVVLTFVMALFIITDDLKE